MTLEREEQQKERELRERMRLQLRLDDEAAQMEAEHEIQRRIQEEKDQVTKKLFITYPKRRIIYNKIGTLSFSFLFLM